MLKEIVEANSSNSRFSGTMTNYKRKKDSLFVAMYKV